MVENGICFIGKQSSADNLLWQKHDEELGYLLPLESPLFAVRECDEDEIPLLVWIQDTHTRCAKNNTLTHILSSLDQQLIGKTVHIDITSRAESLADRVYITLASLDRFWFIPKLKNYSSEVYLPETLKEAFSSISTVSLRTHCFEEILAKRIWDAAMSGSFRKLWQLHNLTYNMLGEDFASPLLIPVKYNAKHSHEGTFLWRNYAEVENDHSHMLTFSSTLNNADLILAEYLLDMWNKFSHDQTVEDSLHLVQLFLPRQANLENVFSADMGTIEPYVNKNFTTWWKTLCSGKHDWVVKLPGMLSKNNVWKGINHGASILHSVGYLMFYEATQKNNEERRIARSLLCTLTGECFGEHGRVPPYPVAAVTRLWNAASNITEKALWTYSVKPLWQYIALPALQCMACAAVAFVVETSARTLITTEITWTNAALTGVHGLVFLKIAVELYKRKSIWNRSVNTLSVLAYGCHRIQLSAETFSEIIQGLVFKCLQFLQHGGRGNGFDSILAFFETILTRAAPLVSLRTSQSVLVSAMGATFAADIAPGPFTKWSAAHNNTNCMLLYDFTHRYTPSINTVSKVRLMNTNTTDTECKDFVEEFCALTETKYEMVDASKVEFGLSTAKNTSEYTPTQMNRLAQYSIKAYRLTDLDYKAPLKQLCFLQPGEIEVADFSFAVEAKTATRGINDDTTNQDVILSSRFRQRYPSKLQKEYDWAKGLTKHTKVMSNEKDSYVGVVNYHVTQNKNFSIAAPKETLATFVELLCMGVLFSHGTDTNSKLIAMNVKKIYQKIIEANNGRFENDEFPDVRVRAAALNELVQAGVTNINVQYFLALPQPSGFAVGENHLNQAGLELYNAASEMLGESWEGRKAFLKVLKDTSPLCKQIWDDLEAADNSKTGSSGNKSDTGGGGSGEGKKKSEGQKTQYRFQQPYGTTTANFTSARQGLYARSCFRRL